MTNLDRDVAVDDVDQTVAALNRARKLKLVLAVAIIVGTMIAALVFAQLSSGAPPAP